MQNLEKALKKNGRIMTLLITALILLILYAIILSGDIGSAKSKTRLSYREQIADLTTEITDIQDGTAANDEKIAGYQEDIDALNADIAAIEAGTYTGN
jgi:septal ring factor EnvC (AmiA/AmiB activator)